MSDRFAFAKQQLDTLNDKGYSSLIEPFQEACEHYTDRRAFSCLGQEVDFAFINEKSGQFAAYLLGELGLQAGDRVAVQLPNLIQYPIVAWGILRAGLVLVNTNPLYTERELVHQFTDSGARALVALHELLPVLEKVVPQTGIDVVIATNVFDMMEAQPLPACSLPTLVSLPQALAAGAQLALPQPSLTMNDIAVLQYTGGTTGVAKGAVLTHGNLFASSRQSAALLAEAPGQDVDDVVVAPMPMYHVYGFTVNVIGTFLDGGLSVLIPDPRQPNSIIDAFKNYPVTSMAGVNTLFIALLQHPEFDSLDFSHVKGIIAGGAALAKEVADDWKRRTGTDIFEGYGLSETSATVSCNAHQGKRRLGTVGLPMIAQQIKVVNSEGDALPSGEEGELLVRGPQIMQGYWQRPEATDEAIDSEGWFRTGDIAVIHPDGFIQIVDRLKDMILVSGFNVYPNEIENVLYNHPDVLECAVVGVKDEKSGEAVKACVTSKNKSLSEAEIRDFCRQELTAYKVPKFVEFRDELPKSNVGKILRRELR